MSRSYKKNPIIKYAPKGKIGKQFANRRVRRFKGKIPFGYSFLKKIYDPWNVHDVVSRNTLAEEIEWEYFWEKRKNKLINRDELDIMGITKKWKKYYYWK